MGTKKEVKVISKKKIVLKNGQSVKLEFYQFPELNSIYAVDKNESIVGILSFEIMHKYVCPLSKEENLEMIHKNVTSVQKNELEINVLQSNRDIFDIKDNVLTIGEWKYKLKKSSAILDLIEIKDKNFFQVGLGSAMHKEMEDFAQKEGCSEIRLAHYFPIGEFAHGARPFYEHKGYVFKNNGGVLEVYKPLQEKSQTKAQEIALLETSFSGTRCPTPAIQNQEETFEASKSSSYGTPINQKYLNEFADKQK